METEASFDSNSQSVRRQHQFRYPTESALHDANYDEDMASLVEEDYTTRDSEHHAERDDLLLTGSTFASSWLQWS